MPAPRKNTKASSTVQHQARKRRERVNGMRAKPEQQTVARRSQRVVDKASAQPVAPTNPPPAPALPPAPVETVSFLVPGTPALEIKYPKYFLPPVVEGPADTVTSTEVREALKGGPRLWRIVDTIASARTRFPNGLPSHLSIPVRGLSEAEYPGRMLAIYIAEFDVYHIVPIHDAVWNTYCALQTLEPVAVDTTPTTNGMVRFPTTLMEIPHPPTIMPLLRFLYTRHQQSLVYALIPLPPRPSAMSSAPIQGTGNERSARLLTSMYTSLAIQRFLEGAQGMHRNMCWLGIRDRELFYFLNGCWKILLMAFDLALRRDKALYRDLDEVNLGRSYD